MKEGVIRLDMDIKVIEQMVEQALKEIKAEQPQKFIMPKAELYGVFKTMDEAIAASEEAQKKLLFSKISDRQKYVDVIRRRWAEFVHGEGCDWQALTPAVEE